MRSEPACLPLMIKSLPTQILAIVEGRRSRSNLRRLLRFFLVLGLMITAYSVAFHVLMAREGQDHSWLTGFYWTLTVMSTLGFGDITFHSDLGRAFSMLVLLSGTIYLLVLLPFTFIEFFYGPWLAAQADRRAPRQLPPGTSGHVLFACHDPVTSAVIERLRRYKYTYYVMIPDVEEALALHDKGVEVMVGNLDDPEAWRAARVEGAALVMTTSSDPTNTNVAFTVRSVAEDVPILATANDEASVDILQLAGSSRVLRHEVTIGRSFARRVTAGDALAHIIGKFDEILIAEATVRRTPIVGKTLRESDLRRKVGVTVVGVWNRGTFEAATADTLIEDNTVLVLAGTRDEIDQYNLLFCIYNVTSEPVVILGGGRVGQATATALGKRGVDYRVVERDPGSVPGAGIDPERLISGNAAELEVLKAAGIDTAPAVIITSRDDDLNTYLALYCRRLNPDIQILSRALLERNVPTLHRAGADLVLSFASIAAGTVMNWLKRSTVLMVAEGLDLFKVDVPAPLVGLRIEDSGIRAETGCTLVGLGEGDGLKASPDPGTVLTAGAEMLLIGTIEAQDRFLARYEVQLAGRSGAQAGRGAAAGSA